MICICVRAFFAFFKLFCIRKSSLRIFTVVEGDYDCWGGGLLDNSSAAMLEVYSIGEDMVAWGLSTASIIC